MSLIYQLYLLLILLVRIVNANWAFTKGLPFISSLISWQNPMRQELLSDFIGEKIQGIRC